MRHSKLKLELPGTLSVSVVVFSTECQAILPPISNKLHENVKYQVKNHVITLTGDVDSQSKRARAEEIASKVLNVQQVVNELQVKAQKATSSN